MERIFYHAHAYLSCQLHNLPLLRIPVHLHSLLRLLLCPQASNWNLRPRLSISAEQPATLLHDKFQSTLRSVNGRYYFRTGHAPSSSPDPNPSSTTPWVHTRLPPPQCPSHRSSRTLRTGARNGQYDPTFAHKRQRRAQHGHMLALRRPASVSRETSRANCMEGTATRCHARGRRSDSSRRYVPRDYKHSTLRTDISRSLC
jgi:hypothetical protein